MGNTVASYEIPEAAELRRVTRTSPISRADLRNMKDELRAIAIREGGTGAYPHGVDRVAL